ncbi:hypothetical protein [Pseudoalteromonas phenolica]|uniref:hypothetical protein n=1 Tax=Pseudoalteromonas phenolica TaxID=161398 RepID=UPI00110A2A17|nr:hypothetical protein [Pseudoalteromonas phenolica]TMO57008.1 hypothetical protein CWC21_03720 [Pseudoalteromonas phenolica]
MTMSFLPHGNLELKVENNILILDLKNSFNKEGVKLVHSKVQSLIDEKHYDKWNLIIFLGKNTLLTMEAIEDTIDFFLWCQNNQCEKVAYVSISSIQEDTANLILENISLKKGFFKNYENAKDWINSSN